MKKFPFEQFPQVRRLALLAAIGSAIAPAMAAEGDEVDRLTNPDTSQFSFELGSVSRDSQRFGMYNGLNDSGGVGIGNLNFVRRDNEGLWFRASGRNLGLSTQEMHTEFEDQGEWRIAVDYGQTSRVSPYEIHTDLQGIGTANLSYANYANATVNPASTAAGISLETNRYKTTIDMSRQFGREIELRVLYQNEKKQGERMFGRGTPSVVEFLAEPIDTLTRQVDVMLNFTGEKLQLSAGYYGSFFDNTISALNVAGGAAGLRTGTPPFTVISLAPDNYAHQFSLTGAYRFTDSTKGNFKLAHTRSEQNDDFIDVGSLCNPGGNSPCNVSGRNDLGGRMDTTLAQLGLNSNPLPKLDLAANLRYENREDKTSIAQYLQPPVLAGTTSSTDGFNEQRSLRIESGKFEAGYQLPRDFRLSAGIDAERKKRSTEGVRVVGYRAEVEEISYRLELRKPLTETLSGSVGYVRSDRTGSDYPVLRTWNVTTNAFNTTTPGGLYALGGLMQPIYIADRDRNKLRVAMDWTPTDALSFQFNVEASRDDYGSARQSPNVGPGSGNSGLFNIDANYNINDNWRVNAWGSMEHTRMSQAACTNLTTGATVGTRLAGCLANAWSSSLENRVDSLGLGVRGKIRGKLDVGGDLSYSRDISEYNLNGAGSGVTAKDLPDINNHQASLKLFAGYPLGKETSLRMDYVLDHRKTNDWTWTDWKYNDGTVIDQHPNETTHFLGVSFRYGFH